jgi:hypothetical protein
MFQLNHIPSKQVLSKQTPSKRLICWLFLFCSFPASASYKVYEAELDESDWPAS